MEKDVVPMAIEQDLDTGFLYLITEGEQPNQRGYNFRLDRIVSMESMECNSNRHMAGGSKKEKNYKIKQKEKYFDKEEKKEAERVSWPQELIHVKVKVFDRKKSGIKERVMRDLRRMHLGSTYSVEDHFTFVPDEKGGYYLYDDDVPDVNKLKSWVFSYGSSMVVVEPESLREQVIAAYRRRSDYYNSENSKVRNG